MSEGTFRPQADPGKIHSKDEFELCYLRHQYLRKTDSNPTQEEMKPFLAIAQHMAKNTYYTYKGLLGIVGFELDDIVSIAQIHLVSFLGLFSLDKMPEKYKEFVANFFINNGKDPSEWNTLDKNRANCTIFIKQRMEDLVRVCRQKARNIKGLPSEEYYFYYGQASPPPFLRDLIGAHERYGYKKLDVAVYKTIKKRVKVDDSPVFRFNGNYYIAVPIEHKSLSLSDFTSAGLDPHDNIHNMSPEQVFFEAEERANWERRQEEFDNKPKNSKAAMIRNFIEKNKENTKMKEELKVARKLLKSIGA
jgi:hypothetical protein